MNRKLLAEEIINFCVEYKIEKYLLAPQSIVEDYLKYNWFVESLIQMLWIKAKYIENVDCERLEKLIADLENVRLELGCG